MADVVGLPSGDLVDLGLIREGIRSKLREAEVRAVTEVEVLGEALEVLRKENNQLRSLLKQNDVEVEIDSSKALSPVWLFEGKSKSSLRLQEESSQPLSAPTLKKRGHEFLRRKTQESLCYDLYKEHGWMQLIAKHPWFEYSALLVVLLNAIWISIDLDLNGKPILESPPLFQIMEQVFVLIFSMELGVRYGALKCNSYIFRDKWFLFDSVLVLFMVVESWALTLILVLTRSDSKFGLGAISALRILRLLRLARLSRLIRIFPELQTMIAGMLAGIRSVVITAIVLLAMTYIFAVILRQLGASRVWGSENFSNVPLAVYTLLVESMLPDNGHLLTEIGMDMWYCAVIYVIFLLLAAVTVMNMLIGILCDVVGEVSSQKREEQKMSFMSDKLQSILRSIDHNYDGLISKAEFESILDNEEAMKILHDVGVDVHSLVEDSEAVFAKHGETMAFEDFRDEVLCFRTTALANMRSLMYLRKFLREQVGEINVRLKKMEDSHLSPQDHRTSSMTPSATLRKQQPSFCSSTLSPLVQQVEEPGGPGPGREEPAARVQATL